jgi:malic enzyme
VALAGILASERATGRTLAQERIVILGGGAAGLGIARQIRAGMASAGVPAATIAAAVAVLDSKGLIVDDAAALDPYKRELAWRADAAAAAGLAPGRRSLGDVVRALAPTVLIGTSGQRGAFTADVVRAMASRVNRPVILPLSNPTDCCEATPADVAAWTDGRALIATGSPFGDVEHAGRRLRVGQGNNAYIFPGVGLAVLAGGLATVPERAFLDAATTLAGAVADDELAAGLLYPPISRLRQVSRDVAVAVLRGEGLAGSDALRRVAERTWEPVYARYVPGMG